MLAFEMGKITRLEMLGRHHCLKGGVGSTLEPQILIQQWGKKESFAN